MPVATSKKTPMVLALSALTALTLTACAASNATEVDDPVDAAAPAETEADPTDTPTEVTVTTAQGDLTVPFQPERVIVIEHGILDTIDTLGAGDAVVGMPHHAAPAHLADFVTDTVNTGTLFEPDYEAINAAEPDLIIVGGRSAATAP